MLGYSLLDKIDRKILRELSCEGRISNSDLAERIGLSASACSRRTSELERTGAIRGYRAVLDPAINGGGFTAYVAVGLSRHTMDEQRAFEKAMADAPAVRECHNVTGAIEYLLRVEVADLDAYKHFHTEVLGALPQVSTITSYIVMESSKDERR
jgi:DNA-binding Lrp family transcriptional regulator